MVIYQENIFLTVEKGFKQAMANGVLAGFSVDSYASYFKRWFVHAVDSDLYLLKFVQKWHLKRLYLRQDPILLEPIMKLEVITPEENMGDVVADLNKRRGLMQGMDDKKWINYKC